MAAAFSLTDEFVKATKTAATHQVEYPDAKVSGLALRVSAKGKKSWTFRFRNTEGRQKRLSLGTYPAVSLAKARIKAVEALGETHDGKDPAKDRRDERARAGLRTIRTLADLAADYFLAAKVGRHRNEARPKRESTIALEEGYFARNISPKFGSFSVNDVTRPDFQRFLDDLGVASPTAARQCRNIVRQIYNFAIRREIADKNPAQFSEVPTSKSRDRVLSDAEVKAIWTRLQDADHSDDVGLSRIMSLATQFALVTLQRGNEVCGAITSEIDMSARTWTIPGGRSKNHRTHVVPLSDLAMNVLKEAISLSEPIADASRNKPHSVFSARRGGPPLTRHAFTRAVKRLTTEIKIADATPHDFRRTGSTHMTSERLGIPRFHVSCVLNHISDTGGAAAVTAVYDRNAYLPEKRRALDKWAIRLLEIVRDRPEASNVVQIHQG